MSRSAKRARFERLRFSKRSRLPVRASPSGLWPRGAGLAEPQTCRRLISFRSARTGAGAEVAESVGILSPEELDLLGAFKFGTSANLFPMSYMGCGRWDHCISSLSLPTSARKHAVRSSEPCTTSMPAPINSQRSREHWLLLHVAGQPWLTALNARAYSEYRPCSGSQSSNHHRPISSSTRFCQNNSRACHVQLRARAFLSWNCASSSRLR